MSTLVNATKIAFTTEHLYQKNHLFFKKNYINYSAALHVVLHQNIIHWTYFILFYSVTKDSFLRKEMSTY